MAMDLVWGTTLPPLPLALGLRNSGNVFGRRIFQRPLALFLEHHHTLVHNLVEYGVESREARLRKPWSAATSSDMSNVDLASGYPVRVVCGTLF